jgi:hypothetical protein
MVVKIEGDSVEMLTEVTRSIADLIGLIMEKR